MGHDEHGNLYVASEMKALVPVCRTIKEFPAGSYLWSQDGEIREYYRRDWFDYDSVKDNVTDAAALRTALEESVKSHLMSDVPYGVLLSGGLDSSVISAITKKYAARRVEDQNAARPGGRSCTPSPSGWKARRICAPRKRWLTTWAPCTMRSTSPCRKGWTPSAT